MSGSAKGKEPGDDSLVGLELVNLLDVDRQTTSSVQATRT